MANIDKEKDKEEHGLSDSVNKVFGESTFIIGIRRIKEWKNANTKLFKRFAIANIIISILISGLLMSLFKKISHEIYEIELGKAIVYGITGFGIILTLILIALLFYIAAAFFIGTHKNAVRDEERNYNVSTTGYNGTAVQMTDEEKRYTFVSGDYDTNLGNILGSEIGQEHLLYAVDYSHIQDGLNKNMCVVGAPGCGKSRGQVIPTIMQLIRRGESAIVTDTKGDLYRKTAEIARAHGYTVKVLNFNLNTILHSDSINYLLCLGLNVESITSMAETVISNMMGTEKDDIWKAGETNLLKACMLYIAYNEDGIPKTLGEVYKMLNENSVTEIENILENVEDDNPCIPYYNNFKTSTSTMKESWKGGLATHLEKLSNDAIKRVTGTDDIDLTLPAREKCIYYIVINDQNPKPMAWLVALTFNVLFEALVNYVDNVLGGEPLIEIIMLMDEFYNLGIIPAFDSKISQVRSRGIACQIFVQSLVQLQDMYAESWEKILDCCSVIICMKTNSLATAEYISSLSGVQTTEDEGERYNESKTDIVRYHGETYKTITHGSRPVYTPDEVLNLDPTHILVKVSSHHIVELEKIDYSSHPMCKEIRRCEAATHTPSWVLALTENEQRKLGILSDTEQWEEEGNKEIELCTPEDFMEHWNPEKEKALQKKIRACNVA